MVYFPIFEQQQPIYTPNFHSKKQLIMMTYTKFFTTIILVFISFIYCLGQDVTITTQAEMDAFDPSTTVINGDLDIDGLNSSADPVTNFNNLSNLTSI